jgi:hypothetical protein
VDDRAYPLWASRREGSILAWLILRQQADGHGAEKSLSTEYTKKKRREFTIDALSLFIYLCGRVKHCQIFLCSFVMLSLTHPMYPLYGLSYLFLFLNLQGTDLK